MASLDLSNSVVKDTSCADQNDRTQFVSPIGTLTYVQFPLYRQTQSIRSVRIVDDAHDLHLVSIELHYHSNSNSLATQLSIT
jgi:hypothetical protein